MTPTGLWLDIGAGENGFTKAAPAFFPGGRRCSLYFPGGIAAHLAAAGGLRAADAVDRAGGGAQFRLVPDHAHADDHVAVLHVPVRILAHFDDGAAFFSDPANHWGMLDAFFIICLILAETYAFFILFLGYFQTIWPLRRAPVALPDDAE